HVCHCSLSCVRLRKWRPDVGCDEVHDCASPVSSRSGPRVWRNVSAQGNAGAATPAAAAAAPPSPARAHSSSSPPEAPITTGRFNFPRLRRRQSASAAPAAAVFAKPALPAGRPARRAAAGAADRDAPLAAKTPAANVDKALLPQQQQAAPAAAAAAAAVPVPPRPLGDVAPEWYKTYRKAFPSFVFYFHDMDQKNTRIFTRFTLLLGGVSGPEGDRQCLTSGPARWCLPAALPVAPFGKSGYRASQTCRGQRKPTNKITFDSPRRRPAQGRSPVKNSRSDEEKRYATGSPTVPQAGHHGQGGRDENQDLGNREYPFCTLRRLRVAAVLIQYTKVLSALMNPSAFDDSARPSLRITLRDEKILGPSAVYRPMKDFYILSEDATGVYRPIIAREYVPTGKDREPWAHLRPRQKAQCPFSKPGITHESQTEVKTDGSKQKKSGAALDGTAERQLNPRASAAAVPKVNPPRRTAGKDARTVLPLPMAPSADASGIVAVGSGVSTANAVTSVQLAGPGAASKGIQQDKMDQLVGKTVPMFQKPKARLKRASALSKSAVPQGLADDVPDLEAKKPEADVKLPRKAGFCENCYAKFDDMEKHIKSKQHRDFATDSANFGQLAALVETVARVPKKPSPVRHELENVKEGDCNDVRELDTDVAGAEGQIVDEDTEDDVKNLHFSFFPGHGLHRTVQRTRDDAHLGPNRVLPSRRQLLGDPAAGVTNESGMVYLAPSADCRPVRRGRKAASPAALGSGGRLTRVRRAGRKEEDTLGRLPFVSR
ncbi:MAG: hypothetical protein BJ554DRAFT_5073, partial [Olpidium bornovanus]